MRHDPRLVIFDCDGVLVDSEVISNRVLAEMLSSEGLPTTLEQARLDYQGLLLADIRTRAEQRLGRALPEDWLVRYETERDAAFGRELQPVAGAVDAVGQVMAMGMNVCVASQSKLTKIGLSLALTGLSQFFPETARFSSYTVAHGKPAPDVFLHAAASMGARPVDCVVVEDTVSGVTAAVSAGMRTLGYAADSDERALRDAGAADVLHSMAELVGMLGLE